MARPDFTQQQLDLLNRISGQVKHRRIGSNGTRIQNHSKPAERNNHPNIAQPEPYRPRYVGTGVIERGKPFSVKVPQGKTLDETLLNTPEGQDLTSAGYSSKEALEILTRQFLQPDRNLLGTLPSRNYHPPEIEPGKNYNRPASVIMPSGTVLEPTGDRQPSWTPDELDSQMKERIRRAVMGVYERANRRIGQREQEAAAAIGTGPAAALAQSALYGMPKLAKGGADADLAVIAKRVLGELDSKTRKDKEEGDRTSGVWRGIKNTLTGEDIATLGYSSILESLLQAQTLEKAAKGERLTDTQQDVLALLRLAGEVENYIARRGGRTIGQQVGAGIGQSIPFMMQFGATAGAGSSAGVAAKVGGKLLKAGINKGLAKGIGTVARMGAEAAKMTPLQAAPYRNYFDRTAAQYNIDGSGNVGKNRPATAFERAYKGLADAYVEVFTEKAGEGFSALFGSLINKPVSKLARHMGYAGQLSKLPKSAALTALKKRVGFNGAVGEFTEEMLGDALSPLLTGETEKWKENFSAENTWITFLTTSLMSTGFAALEAPNAALYMRDAAALRQGERRALQGIGNADLRKAVVEAMQKPSIGEQSKALTAVDWKSPDITEQDAAMATDYALMRIRRNVLSGMVSTDAGIEQINRIREILAQSSYRGIDGQAPTGEVITATTTEGAELTVIAGALEDTVPDNTVFVRDDTGEVRQINREELQDIERLTIDEAVSQHIETARKEQETQEEAIRRQEYAEDAQIAGIQQKEPETSTEEILVNEDRVTLADGRQGVVVETRPAGYVVETDDGRFIEVEHGGITKAETLPQPDADGTVTHETRQAEPASKSESQPVNTARHQKRHSHKPSQSDNLGDYVSIDDVILRDIANGLKFRWNDKDKRRGLARELGFVGKEEERKQRIQLLNNSGVTPEEYAEQLYFSYGRGNEGQTGVSWNLDDAQIKDRIIEILGSVYTTLQARERADALHKEDNPYEDYTEEDFAVLARWERDKEQARKEASDNRERLDEILSNETLQAWYEVDRAYVEREEHDAENTNFELSETRNDEANENTERSGRTSISEQDAGRNSSAPRASYRSNSDVGSESSRDGASNHAPNAGKPAYRQVDNRYERNGLEPLREGHYSEEQRIAQHTESGNDLHERQGNARNPSIPSTEAPTGYGTANRLVTSERYEELRQRMRDKLPQINIGFDPEILAIGAEMAAYHVEAGARKFADFAHRMVNDLGDAIIPYLKAIYTAGRRMPGMEEYAGQMDTDAAVEAYDLNRLDSGKKETARSPKVNDTNPLTVRLVGIYDTSCATAKDETETGNLKSEKKFRKDLTRFSKALSAALGWEHDTDKKGNPVYATTNIPPAGGEGHFILWKPGTEYGVYVMIPVEPNGYDRSRDYSDTLRISDTMQQGNPILWRITGKANKYIGYDNHYVPADITAGVLAELVKHEINHYLTKDKQAENPTAEKATIVREQPQIKATDAQIHTHILPVGGNSPVENGREYPKSAIGIRRERTGGTAENDREESRVRPYVGGKPDKGGDGSGHSKGIHDDAARSERDAGISGGNRSERAADAANLAQAAKNSQNHEIVRGQEIAPSGQTAKIKANIDAIRLAAEIEKEGREATPQEKNVLVKYSGWGGLASVFKPDNPYYETIQNLLTEEEYDSARASTTTSFYTPTHIVTAIWDMAEKLGFKGGNVLEPASGIGHFFGLMPRFLSAKSNLTGIEKDEVSGRILRLLYPDADVQISGYEDIRIPNNSVDLVVTNVPFGTFKVFDKTDRDLSKQYDIHDYFIAKSIRKLKPGGIGIFITPTATLDRSDNLRRWVTSEGNADFIGAVRLNTDTFKANAGTETSADIVIISKRDVGGISVHAAPMQETSIIRKATYTWIPKATGIEEEKTAVMVCNQYFLQHPEYMAGGMRFGFEDGNQMRPTEQRCIPTPDIDQQEIIGNFIQNLPLNIFGAGSAQRESVQSGSVQGDGTKEGGLTLIDGKAYIIRYGTAEPVLWNTNKVAGHSKTEALRDYLTLKKAIDTLLEAEVNDDPGMERLRLDMNSAYDRFQKRYGPLSHNQRLGFLRDDVDYPTIAALEVAEKATKNGKKTYEINKSDIFRHRIISPRHELQAESIEDGIRASAYQKGRLDTAYIAGLLDRPQPEVVHEMLERRLAFVNPATGLMEERDEYLSGNVREKLRLAEQAAECSDYKANVEELRKVQPLDLPLAVISVTLGSTWVPMEVYNRFFADQFGVKGEIIRTSSGSYLSKLSGTGNAVDTSKGISNFPGSKLALEAMNNIRSVVYRSEYDPVSQRTKRVVDHAATAQAAIRQAELREQFESWCKSSDNPFKEEMESVYNTEMNCMVERRYDVSGFDYFPNASRTKKPREHQKIGVLRALREPTMLAHEVGTGKTMTQISIAMEMRRLGIAKKPCIIVQRSTFQQFLGEIKSLYPAAKVLAPTEKDLTASQRQNLFAKIAYNDWDIVLLYHNYLDSIPDDPDRVELYIDKLIQERLQQIDEIAANKPNNEKRLISELEREIERLEERKALPSRSVKEEEKLKAASRTKALELLNRRTDKTYYFEKLGIDALIVDEWHTRYKRLGFVTHLENIRGIDTAASQAAQSLKLKSEWILQQTGGKNVVFATGTPISNTAAEMWTVFRYLMPETELTRLGINHFDGFVQNFGHVDESAEFNASGKFKVVSRFAAYNNLPELKALWRKVAHTVLTEEVADLREGSGTPRIEGGKPTDLMLEQTAPLKQVMKGIKAVLNRWEELTGKEKRRQRHIPLVMFGLAKRAAIDVRLVNPELPDDPGSKLNRAVKEILNDLKATESYRGTAALFCDSYQSSDRRFNVFTDIKSKLINAGIQAKEIAIVNDYRTDKQRDELWKQVNNGEVRVVMGSTEKLGVGVNIQERLHWLGHLDAPIRPSDYWQRGGRILRQGNIHLEMGIPVRILRFGVKKTLDVTGYQRLRIKENFIRQIMSSDMSYRSVDEVETEGSDSSNFAEMMAVLSGSQAAVALAQEQNKLKRLKNAYDYYKQEQAHISYRIKYNENILATTGGIVERLHRERKELRSVFPTDKVETVGIGKLSARGWEEIERLVAGTLGKRIEAEGDALKNDPIRTDAVMKSEITINGKRFRLTIEFTKTFIPETQRNRTTKTISYQCDELPGLYGTVNAKVENVIRQVDEKISAQEIDKEIGERLNGMERAKAENEQLRPRLGQPFSKETELKRAIERVETLEKQMAEEVKRIEAAEAADTTEAIEIDPDSFGADDQARLREGEEPQAAQENSREIVQAAAELAEALHTPLEIVEDTRSITDENPAMRQRKLRAKGWYEPASGKVVIVVPNNKDAADAQATVLHEVVGHVGLRAVLGERFVPFVEAACRGLDAEGKRQVERFAAREKLRRGIMKQEAMNIGTEEYLATLAEGNITPGRFARIVGRIRELLREMFGVPLIVSENDVAYMLWRSRRAMERPLTATQAIRMAAAERAVRRVLYGEGTRLRDEDSPREQANQYRPEAVLGATFAKKGKGLVLEGPPPSPIFDKRSLKRRAQMLLIDSTLPVRLLQEEIIRRGGRITDITNVHKHLNHFTSAAKVEIDRYRRDYLMPVLDNIASLARRSRLKQEAVIDYITALSSLERHKSGIPALSEKEEDAWNVSKAHRFVTDFLREVYGHRDEVMRSEGAVALTQTEKKLLPAKTMERLQIYGFDALTHEEQEKLRDAPIRALWYSINAANDRTLDILTEGGLLDRQAKERIKKYAWKYYVPLRSWDYDIRNDAGEQEVFDPLEVYEFAEPAPHSYPTAAWTKTARGRTRKPFNPIAEMVHIGIGAIITSRMNRARQSVLRLAKNTPQEDLYRVNRIWLVKGLGGRWTETAIEPDAEALERSREARRKLFLLQTQLRETDRQDEERIREIHVKMAEERERETVREIMLPSSTRFGRETPVAPYKEEQKTVECYVNGKKFVVTFSDPAVANAINGMNRVTIPGWVENSIGEATRWLARAFTSRNPAFVATNFLRDVQHAALVQAIDRDGDVGKFIRTIGPGMSSIVREIQGKGRPLTMTEMEGLNILKQHDRKLLAGRFGRTRVLDTLYDYFRTEGGETGFVHGKDVREAERDVRSYVAFRTGTVAELLKNAKGGEWAGIALSYAAYRTGARAAARAFDNASKVAENASRFATFLTSLDNGRTLIDAVNDAKHVTVNFNQRGTATRALGMFYVFFNASVQGAVQVSRLAWRNRRRFGEAAAGMLAGGFLNSMLVDWFIGSQDDDDLPYYVSDYDRENHLVIPLVGSKGFVKIPLPQGFRAFHATGVLLHETYRGRITPEECCRSIVMNLYENFSPVASPSPRGDIGRVAVPTALTPFYDIAVNENAFGYPIGRQSYGNGPTNYPLSEMGLRNVNKAIYYVCSGINKLGGGDENTPAGMRKDGRIDPLLRGLLEWNPSHVEHVLTYYGGGMGKFARDVVHTTQALIDADTGLNTYDLPLVNRLYGTLRPEPIAGRYYGVRERLNNLAARYRRAGTAVDMADKQLQIDLRKYKLICAYDAQVKKIRAALAAERPASAEYEKLEEELDRVMWQAVKTYEDDTEY